MLSIRLNRLILQEVPDREGDEVNDETENGNSRL